MLCIYHCLWLTDCYSLCQQPVTSSNVLQTFNTIHCKLAALYGKISVVGFSDRCVSHSLVNIGGQVGTLAFWWLLFLIERKANRVERPRPVCFAPDVTSHLSLFVITVVHVAVIIRHIPASWTNVMPQRMLQIQPTMMTKVASCSSPTTTLMANARALDLSRVDVPL